MTDNLGKRKGNVSDKPIEITDENFHSYIENNELVVVDCWAPWCAPCRIIAPTIEALAKDYSGKVLFGKLNVDENQEVAMRYNVMAIPTLLFFKKGELVDRLTGAAPRNYIEDKVRKHL